MPRRRLPGWPEHLIRDQVQLASRSMADKEVYLGVDLGTSRRVLHALSGLGRQSGRQGGRRDGQADP